jgi:hypothetical protein
LVSEAIRGTLTDKNKFQQKKEQQTAQIKQINKIKQTFGNVQRDCMPVQF